MKLTFEQWLAELDKILIKETMLSHDDAPDCAYSDWYQDGLTPARAAKRAKREWRTF